MGLISRVSSRTYRTMSCPNNYQEFTLDGPLSDSDQGYHSKSSSEASIENDNKTGKINSDNNTDGIILTSNNLNPTTQVINNNERLSGNEQEGRILNSFDDNNNQNEINNEDDDDNDRDIDTNLSPFFGHGHPRPRYSEYSLEDDEPTTNNNNNRNYPQTNLKYGQYRA